MKSVEIEDDVYYYLLGRATEANCTPSEFLRRAFARLYNIMPESRGPGVVSYGPVDAAREGTPPSDIERWVRSTRFLAETTSLGRYITLLALLYKKHGDDFACILDLSGRKRRYFALTAQALEDTGTSVFPKQIAGSPYWAVTNIETAKKRQIIETILRMLAYSGPDIRIAVSAI